VRNFPRTTWRRLVSAVAIGSMLAGVAALPAATADDLKDKKHKVERHIERASEHLDESSARLRRATAALQRSQARLSAAQAHLARTRGELAAAEVLDRQMQAKLDAAIARLRQARADLDAGRAKIVDQERDLGRIVVENYQTGDPALMGLSMVLTSQDPAQLTGQLNSVRNVIDKEAVILDRLEASKVLLTVQEQEVEDAKAVVAQERVAAAENLRRKQLLEAEAESAEADVAVLVANRRDARQAATSARKADLRELQALRKERNRIESVLRARAERARRRAMAAGASSSAAHPGGFLSWPVDGPITSPYGWRTHPIYGYRSLHDGVDFGVPCGTPIVAPAAGRVLEEYFQTAYGNRIIIDHGFQRGVGLATISNHLSRYAVSPGQRVQRGQVIGYVGNTGWSTGCHLHFTVLENGAPVDPMPWL
jgi:murein DD-endopeptidase MepM/ murein hydrolase activator NlpD